MATELKGTLTKIGSNIRVVHATKKGSANFAIPPEAKKFRDEDFQEGIEVDVVREGNIKSVTIPGKDVIEPVVTPPSNQHSKNHRGQQGGGPRGAAQLDRRPAASQPSTNVRVKAKASPEIIGSAFTNPYTFLPFEPMLLCERVKPTALSADETTNGVGRLTGVIVLDIKTTSPLLTCDPTPSEIKANGHKVRKALTIGNDVIVPATGIRGSLRTLMTIVTGGTLGYLDDTAYLIQGRDAKLGPATRNDNTGTVPIKPFLAEVIVPGNANRPGRIRLGKTELVRLTSLKQVLSHSQLDRGPRPKPVWLELNAGNEPSSPSPKQTEKACWRLRLSGRPVGGKRIEDSKREGVFNPSGSIIEIPPKLWAAYLGRHASADHSELNAGDLVWLQPADNNCQEIKSADDIKSLQWARWGKEGQPLEEKIPRHLHPDAWNADGLVDEVTNLFGQVRDKTRVKEGSTTLSFAARVRPENLVFPDAASKCDRVVLAPLSMPHPGCIAFYRDCDNPDDVSTDDDLRGYKVYRTTQERGDDAPWHYAVQGVYKEARLEMPPERSVNQTVDLLREAQTGTLRISYRALTPRELALLVYACELPWRLGGGKPLGLGACLPTVKYLIDEDACTHSPAELLGGDDWQQRLLKSAILVRGERWKTSQKPVNKLRYPRAVKGNSRGGHGWFGTHARPRQVSKGDDGKRSPGLAPIYIDGKLVANAKQADQQLDPREPMIAGQLLPMFDPDNTLDDLLYGYDLVARTDHGRANTVTEFEPVQDDGSNRGNYPRHDNESQNRESRQKKKEERK